MDEPDEYLTVPEVAQQLKLSKSKVYSLVQQGEIPHIKIGRNVRIRRSDLDKILNIYYQDKLNLVNQALAEILQKHDFGLH